MFTGPVGPVELCFNWPKSIFGNFYWPGACEWLTVSVEPCCVIDTMIVSCILHLHHAFNHSIMSSKKKQCKNALNDMF